MAASYPTFVEIAHVFACVDHIASSMVNTNHRIERTAVNFPVARCIADAVITREWCAPVSGAECFTISLDEEGRFFVNAFLRKRI